MSSFRSLLIWQKAMALATRLYQLTTTFPREEIYGLTLQIRRCGISIPSNISEGSGRETNKEYLRFLYIATASLFELQTQIEIAKNIHYLTESEFNSINKDCHELEKMLISFIFKVKQRNT